MYTVRDGAHRGGIGHQDQGWSQPRSSVDGRGGTGALVENDVVYGCILLFAFTSTDAVFVRSDLFGYAATGDDGMGIYWDH